MRGFDGAPGVAFVPGASAGVPGAAGASAEGGLGEPGRINTLTGTPATIGRAAAGAGAAPGPCAVGAEAVPAAGGPPAWAGGCAGATLGATE